MGIILPALLMLYGGGNHEDIKQIRMPWIKRVHRVTEDTLSTYFKEVPEGKRIMHVSLDSEYYQSSVINYLQQRQVGFCIVAVQDIRLIYSMRMNGVIMCSAEEVVWKYNERGQMENGFGADYMPSGDSGAETWFSLQVLAYNSFIMQRKLILPEAYKAVTVVLRWRLTEGLKWYSRQGS